MLLFEVFLELLQFALLFLLFATFFLLCATDLVLNERTKYHGFFVVELLSFLVDVLDVLFELELFLAALEGV